MCFCCCRGKVSVHDVLSVTFIDAHVVGITFWRQAAICLWVHLPLSKTPFISCSRLFSLFVHCQYFTIEIIQMQKELTSELPKVLAPIWIVGNIHKRGNTFQMTILFHYADLISVQKWASCKVIRLSALKRLFIMVSLFKIQQILFGHWEWNHSNQKVL